MTTTRPNVIRARLHFGGADPYPTPLPGPKDWQEKAAVYFPHCLKCALEKIEELAVFPDNWDGYGAKRFAPAMLDAARRFITRLSNERGDLMLVPGTETACQPFDIVPLSSGAIQLTWDVADRHLELEFETPEHIHFLQWCPKRGVEVEDVYFAANLGRSAQLLRWVLTGHAD